MTAPPLKAWIITLNFGENGPLTTNLWCAPDAASAAAMAALAVVRATGTGNDLMGVLAEEIRPDQLRTILRAIEGGGASQVVSLVQPAEPANREQFGPPIPIDDLARAKWPVCWAPSDRVTTYAEEFGPPMPISAFRPLGKWPGWRWEPPEPQGAA